MELSERLTDVELNRLIWGLDLLNSGVEYGR
ncbi:hypothetical protein STW0522KLE44_10950 [Klebsiella sp. STW0522-44]|nr:hypothetical protein STW0522KLE44_10950 [Klebsiella sp. STW0522-44]